MKENYDAIIIGAGISGLVCGCYLAKAGVKTLNVEKNAKPGGYCASFVSKGFHFDTCAHAISSLRKDGRLSKLLNGIGINDQLSTKKHDPSEIIITPDHRIEIFSDFGQTVSEFQKNFPKQKKQIEEFFKFIVFSPIDEFLLLRRTVFEQMLDKYFDDTKLKTILSIMMLQLVGLHPSRLSALVACLLWREFMFDGGYYPVGGMQRLADVLLERFIELNGEAIFCKKVREIKINKNSVKGVVLEDERSLCSRYVVAACDSRQTFFDLLGQHNISEEITATINSMEPSSSGFLVYLGLDEYPNDLSKLRANHYIINNCDMDKLYSSFLNCDNEHFAITSSTVRDPSLGSKESICLASNGLYKEQSYWNSENKNKLANKFIKLTEKIIPDLSKHIVFKSIATPLTLYHWTLNYQGAAYGWASTPEQFQNPDISERTAIDNLYITGHWANSSSGITFVANSAFNAAKLVVRKAQRK